MKSKQPATKRKYPSGAQKLKRRAEREARRLIESGEIRDQWGSPSTFSASPRQQQGEHEQLPVYGVPAPRHVPAIEATLIVLEQGQFDRPAQLADSMLRDSQIYGVLGVRVGGLLGAKVDLEPARDTRIGRKAKEAGETSFSDMFPQHDLEELFRSALLMGAAVAQIIYERNGRSWVPKIKFFHNRFLFWNWGTRCYNLITEDAGIIEIRRGDPGWLVFEPFGPLGWLRCLMRPLALPWLIRNWTRKWWSREREVHGMPVRLGIIPAERDPKDERVFLSQLANLAQEAVVRLPQGEEGNRFDVKLLEAASNSWSGFQALLQHCDDSIAIAALGQRTSTGGSTGLGSDKNPGDAVRTDIKRRDAQVFAYALREQVLKLWAKFNFGDEDLAPYVVFLIEPPEDMSAKAQELSTLGDALTKFALAKAPVDIRALLERHNVPLLDVAQAPPDVPGTPDPDPMPPDDEEDDDDESDTEEVDADLVEGGPGGKEENEEGEGQGSKAAVKKLHAPKVVRKLNRTGYGPQVTLAAKAADKYTQQLATNAKEVATRALARDVATVRAVIAASTDPADLRKHLREAFKAMQPDHLQEVVTKTLTLANFAGRAAVQADVKHAGSRV